MPRKSKSLVFATFLLRISLHESTKNQVDWMQVEDVWCTILLRQLVILLRHYSEVDVLGMWKDVSHAALHVFRSPDSRPQCPCH